MRYLAGHLLFRVTRAASAVAVAMVASLSLAAEPLRSTPKAEECIDVARLNSVSESERAVLRMEWRAGLARAEESRLLNEMFERIERMHRTTYEISVLMNAIPSPSERAKTLNSPSGIGPSAVIPPIAAPPARKGSESVLTAPSLGSQENASVIAQTPNLGSTGESASSSQVNATTPVDIRATENGAAPGAPPAAPTTPPRVAPVSAPTVVSDEVIDDSFSFKPPGNFELAGGGLVFVSLVVLWWLRRRADSPVPEQSYDSEEFAKPARMTPKEVRPVAPTSAGNRITEVQQPSFPNPATVGVSTTDGVSHAPPAPPAVSHDETLATSHSSESSPQRTAIDPPADALPVDEVPPQETDRESDAATTLIAGDVVDFPLDAADDPPNDSIMNPAPTEPPLTVSLAVDSAPPPSTAQEPAQSEESIIELAEMMLAMGLATGAAQKLVDHIRDNPKKALAHWLKLLEIYRESGQRSKFEQAAKQLQKEFNIRASDWMRGSVDRPRLEKFDRVYTKTESLWTRPAQCIEFLSGILADNRDGTRVGFPQEVAEEILLLIDIQKDVGGISDT
jgi:hypothetical protein